MRSKINEYFEFPTEIDMAPYEVEYLKDTRQAPVPDMFNLVGILVHSGNAESGHYYSYIRERSPTAGQVGRWVEFNDADVNNFDPANIPDQCYGGPSEAYGYNNTRFLKAWNAYMLFYERAKPTEPRSVIIPSNDVDTPLRCEIPLELGNRIAHENETWIRRFCLFDPEHARFTRQLLEQYRTLSKDICSEDHRMEKEVISCALEHLEQILSRAKDSPDFHFVLDILVKIVGDCPECCKMTLDWISTHELALRNLLLRSPDEGIRQRFARMVADALSYLREHDPNLYGIDADQMEQEAAPEDELLLNGAFHGIVRGLRNLFVVLHTHTKAWDDYYGLVLELARFGKPECFYLHREGFLAQCLNILVIDCGDPRLKKLKSQMPHLAHYARLVDKGRKYSLVNLVALSAALLDCANLDSRPLNYLPDGRLRSRAVFELTDLEDQVLRFSTDAGDPKTLAVLDRAISQDRQDPRPATEMVKIMVRADPYLNCNDLIFKTLANGINIEPASHAKPYLHASLTFCENCQSAVMAQELVHIIAKEVDTIGNSGGEEHLDFFARLKRVRNDRLRPGKVYHFFHLLVLKLVPVWAPTLLMYHELAVREETLKLLMSLVFNIDTRRLDNEEEADEVEHIAKRLCLSCLKRLDSHMVAPRRQVDAKHIHEIVKVVEHCIGAYYVMDESSDHDRAVVEDSKSQSCRPRSRRQI